MKQNASFSESLASFARKNEGVLIASSMLMVWLMGAYGFIVALDLPGTIHNCMDALYLSLQLFLVNSGGMEIKQYSLSFEVARWIAPMLVALATLRAVISFMKERVALLKLGSLTRHTIVCGIGRKGDAFVSDFIRHHGVDNIVLIDKDAENPFMQGFRNQGVITLTADASDPMVLEQVGIRSASRVLMLAHDDSTNIRITQSIHSIVQNDRMAHHLSCYVQVDSDSVRKLLYGMGQFAESGHRLSLHLFNVYERAAARMLLSYFSGKDRFSWQSRDSMHILFVGFNRIGRELALQTVRLGCFPDQRKLRISVLDKDSWALSRRLGQEMPDLSRMVDIRFYAIDPDYLPSEMEKLESLPFYVPGKNEVSDPDGEIPHCDMAFVNFDDEIRSYDVASSLAKVWNDGAIPPEIVLCVNDDRGIAGMVGAKSVTLGNVSIRFYEVLKQTCSFHALVNPDNEILAKAIHYDYVLKELEKATESSDSRDLKFAISELIDFLHQDRVDERRHAKQFESVSRLLGNPSLLSWGNLSEDKKCDNREQAEHILVKLALIGCKAEPHDSQTKEYVMTNENIDLLARVEHTRWMTEKILNGWQFGVEKDSVKKTNPLLIPYDKLSQIEKDKDVNTILNIPKLLALTGMKITMATSELGS